MLRHAIFSLVAGGIIGTAVGFVILKSSWLTHATIRFLRIVLWFPFIVLFAVPDTFTLGIVAVMLCAIYHFLTARSLLKIGGKDALRHVAREATLQAILITLIAQMWTQRWQWTLFAAIQNAGMGFGVLASLVALLSLINWIFKSRFQVLSERCAVITTQELNLAGRSSFLGVVLFTVVWLLLWQVTSLILGIANSSPFDALRETLELVSYGIWGDITTSLLEIVGGMFVGGSLAVAISTILYRSEKVQSVVIDLLPIAYISPIALWLLVFLFVDWLKVNHSLGYGHKIIGIGLLTFFPFVQALWGFRDHSSRYRILVAIDHALPMAFVAMLFGELYAATAGLGFLMVVASATYQYQKGLAGFLMTAVLFAALSSLLRLILRSSQTRTESSIQPNQ